MYILVVEDERRLAQVVRKVLEEEGHTVDVAYDGEDGLAMAMEGSHDVIALDILLPRMDGLEVCRALRANRVDTPVLLLTALDAVEDRVRGLDAGADDYLPKPFAFQEFLARLRALGRRRVQVREPDRLRAADLVLDLRRRRAERNGKTIELSPKEFALLEFL
ncbi:MAG: response regulator transcription factor, partial [Dehalococcoidia bacterium]